MAGPAKEREGRSPRGWEIKIAADTSLPEINSWLKLPVVVESGLQTLVFFTPVSGSDSEAGRLHFDQQGRPVKLTQTFSSGHRQDILLNGHAVVMGGEYPYDVLFVGKPTDYKEGGRKTEVIVVSSDGGIDILNVLLNDDTPEHIRKAAEFAQAHATQTTLSAPGGEGGFLQDPRLS